MVDDEGYRFSAWPDVLKSDQSHKLSRFSFH